MSCRRAAWKLRWRSSLIGPPSERRRWLSTGRSLGRDTHRSLLDEARQRADGRRVTIAGLVRSVRKQKRVAFAHIQDGTTYEPIQAIIDPELVAGITNGAYVELSGRWEASKGKGQAFELQVEQIRHIGESNADENPIQKQSMGPDYLRTIPHMRMRTPFQSLLARVRSRLMRSAADYFDGLDPPAIQVHPPLITSSDCEGAGEVFTLSPQSSYTSSASPSAGEKDKEARQFFREPKYLTVSSQLHLEAWAAELGNVWTLSPTFRAEESDTSRHLAEFYMLEAEFRSADDDKDKLASVTRIAEALIKSLTHDLAHHRTGTELLSLYADRKHRPGDAEFPDLADRWARVTDGAFVTVSYTDAVHELSRAATSSASSAISPPAWHDGLALEHERWIVDSLGRGRPVIVTDYPRAQKPFYMLPSCAHPDEGRGRSADETVACFDILLPHGYAEVCGGSLREHRLAPLIASMRQKKLLKQVPLAVSDTDEPPPPPPPYPHLHPGESLGSLQWYADLRRFGSSPHGGFGLGFDRLLAYLSGAPSVRDVVGFPRYWGRADC